mmetsp:Transcript_29059/g.57049  ORF Transcript_29059/g.57049 Transcript_29059/m.57049 type:complete len:265 (+) Transcript_29059:29-823(+)
MSARKCHNMPLGDAAQAKSLVPALITEFIGTFFLVLTVYLCVSEATANPGTLPLAPLAIGTALGVMVYMGGHISGGHYNPAVTVGCALSCRSKLGSTWLQVLSYIAVQCFGGIMAALVGYGLRYEPTAKAVVLAPSSVGPGIAAEIIFTFALVTVVLNVATTETSQVPGADGNINNQFFGFAIGSTLFVGATSIGKISGCAINPAVGTGLILVDTFFGGGASAFTNIWIYWVGPLTGAGMATAVYFLTNPREYAPVDKSADQKA